MAIMRLLGHGSGHDLELKASGWLWPYYAGLALISYLGNYGKGLGLIPDVVDMAVLTGFSLGVFWLAIRLRLAPQIIKQSIAAERDEMQTG